MLPNPIYLLAILSITLHCATGLYFHLAEGERKCFIEEVPSDTMVTSELNVEIHWKYKQNHLNELKLMNMNRSFAAHYKIELYDSRSGGFAPPSLGKCQLQNLFDFFQSKHNPNSVFILKESECMSKSKIQTIKKCCLECTVPKVCKNL